MIRRIGCDCANAADAIAKNRQTMRMKIVMDILPLVVTIVEVARCPEVRALLIVPRMVKTALISEKTAALLLS